MCINTGSPKQRILAADQNEHKLNLHFAQFFFTELSDQIPKKERWVAGPSFRGQACLNSPL
jgi:hypothetical protein